MRQFAMRLEPANILPPCVTHIDYYPAITSTRCHVLVENTREAYHEVDTFDDVNFTIMRPMWPFTPKGRPNLRVTIL